MKKNIIVILDPAHGANVKGKASPDGRHLEYKWSRERVKNLKARLCGLGYEVHVTTESENEPGLSKRKRTASRLSKGKTLLISLHNNAAGNGRSWMSATGTELFTTPGVTDADICADVIIKRLASNFPEVRMRLNKDAYLQRDKEAAFTVLMGAGYMGVLVEWLFQDNKSDVQKLLDPSINEVFESSLVEAIEELNDYFNG